MIHKKLLSLLVLLMTTVSMSAKVPYMQISVTVPTGNSITLKVTPNSTIGEVKETIEQQTLIPSELQILTFNNQVLVDEQSVGYYDIPDDAALTLSLVSGNYYLNGGSTDNCPVSFKVGNNENAGTAQEGNEVTVTFTPTAPYVLTAVTAQAYTTWAGARRAEPEPTPTIPVLGDIELTPVQGQANTYTFTMPPSHVKFNNTLRQSSGLAWTLGGNELADGATVNYCKGFPFTAPVLFNPNGLHYQFEVEGAGIALDDNTAVTVDDQEAQPGTYTITVSYDGDETYQATTVTYNLVISEPAILSVAADPTTGGTVEVVIPESGVIANQDGTYSVVPGTSVTLKATAANGYQLNSWSDNVMPDTDDNTVATITVDATATATAYFGEKEYEVDLTVNGDDDQGTEKAKWTGKAGEQGTAKNFPIKAKTGQAVTISYNGRRKVKAVTATTDAEPVTLATPLTVEALTDGIIEVTFSSQTSDKCHGMKYSVNGGTKKEIKTTETIEGLKAGDKVQFYGIGTSNTSYGFSPEVKISGGTATVKVYGNIMSLLDETGFATMTDLPNDQYVFFGLFAGNTTLIDASELLLPAATLTNACYQGMFEGCTNLTTAPKLPAETLAEMCYEGMFNGCNRLTNAYVKAAFTAGDFECDSMFEGCTADGAVLHTTPGDSKESWETKMGPNKDWETWTVADDWQD